MTRRAANAILLFGPALIAQNSPVAFEAASVRQASQAGRMRIVSDSGQITFTNVTLMNVVLRAYDVRSYQVTAPDWLNSERYDIAAKIPPGTTAPRLSLMLQKLLADRFQFAAHIESREIAGYELVVGKSGAKMKASSGAIGVTPGIDLSEGVKGKSVVSYLTATAQPVSALADVVSREFRLPILDHTGLTGLFDFKLEFAPERPGALPSADAPADAAANLMTAVQDQLGLKLNPKKVPVDVVVVDRANRTPTEN